MRGITVASHLCRTFSYADMLKKNQAPATAAPKPVDVAAAVEEATEEVVEDSKQEWAAAEKAEAPVSTAWVNPNSAWGPKKVEEPAPVEVSVFLSQFFDSARLALNFVSTKPNCIRMWPTVANRIYFHLRRTSRKRKRTPLRKKWYVMLRLHRNVQRWCAWISFCSVHVAFRGPVF